MSKMSSASKINLQSIDSLFGNTNTSSEIDATKEEVIEVNISDLHTFKNHPYRVVDDEKMQETVESIKEHGVLVPGIVRRRINGGYEIISGHRRKRACELAGLTKMPVFVRDLTDDEAIIVMVDSNIQREEILPSEKAKAYKMKYEAMKHQGISKGEGSSLEQMSEELGESKTTIQRYITLADMNDDLLHMIDEKKIGLTQGVTISSLSDNEQQKLADIIKETSVIPSQAQSSEIKDMSKKGTFEENLVRALLTDKPVPKKKNITIKADKIKDYIPEGYSEEQIVNLIISLLDEWKKKN